MGVQYAISFLNDAEGFANLFKMSDIFLRKRTNRISKPKWININPKKFRKFQQGRDDVQNVPASSVTPKQMVQTAKSEKQNKVCQFYSRNGICKRFKSPCPFRHDNSQEISPSTSTMVFDDSELIFFEPLKTEDGPPPAKKLKPNESEKEAPSTNKGRPWYPKQNVGMSKSVLFWI